MKNRKIISTKEIIIKRPDQLDEILTSEKVESLNIDFQNDKISIIIELKN